LDDAKSAVSRFYEVFKKFPVYKDSTTPCPSNLEGNCYSPVLETIQNQFHEAMNDDFNTAKAIACLFDIAKIAFSKSHDESVNIEAAYLLYELGTVLGFFKDLEAKLANNIDDKAEKLILLLIDIRNQAKKDKNFALADKIRDELKGIGIELRDTPEGTEFGVRN
jgi:cysteinyl-tRNA synthetase